MIAKGIFHHLRTEKKRNRVNFKNDRIQQKSRMLDKLKIKTAKKNFDKLQDQTLKVWIKTFMIKKERKVVHQLNTRTQELFPSYQF